MSLGSGVTPAWMLDEKYNEADEYKTLWLVSRRGWFKVTPVAFFESECRANTYADWLSDSFQQSYSVQPVAQAD